MKTPAPRLILEKSLHILAPLAALAGALAIGGCAQAPRGSEHHAKEYFSSSIYGAASPRVVADGADVPKGGGKYLVGKPYTVAGRTYTPSERKFTKVGLASWYGDAFHGRRTANGEIYDKNGISAANPTMPLPSYARVTNLRNHRSIIVRVNDRGPYHGGRIMDLSARAAEALDYKRIGTAMVKVEYVGRAAIGGSDDRKLLASLRYDGQPAQLDDGSLSPVRVADQMEPPRSRPDRESERLALAQPESLSQDTAPQRPSEADARPVEQASERVAQADFVDPVAQLPRNPPLPPQRPFDLGTIPGAGVPVSVGRE